MSRFHVLLASVVVGAAAVLLAGQDASQAAALFQQGLLLERAQGNVDQALVLYERVIADYPEDTQVLPQVLSHLAEIYDSRNDPRGIRMWSRLASDFGTTPYADAARRRLANTQTHGPFRSRSIDVSGASPDVFAAARNGQTVAVRKHGAAGDEIWLHDVDTGRDQRLLQETGRVVRKVGWSPDGRRLAVVTSPAGAQANTYGGWDLRLADAQGNHTATVATAETGRILFEWSPDGRWVFAQIGVSSGPKVEGGEIRLIDAETLQSRKLAGPTSWISVGGALWSRNSRQFIYQTQTGNAAGDLSFWIASVAAAEVRPWTPSFVPGGGRIHLATGMTQTWTTDDRVLLQEQAAAGSNFYLIPAGGGAAEKSCTTIPGRFACLRAMTPDGRLGLAEDTIAKRLMLLDLGKPDAPRRLTTGFASETSPNLSPDGRLVTFAANPDGTWALYALPIDRAPGNAVRIDSLGTDDFTAMAWTPSGRLIGDLYTEDEDVYRIKIDATGHPVGPADRLTQDSLWNDSPAVSPASDRIAYNYEHGIAVMTADGAAERPVLTARTTGPLQWRSADEVIFRRAPQAGNSSSLSVLNVDTGAVQPLVDLPPAAQLMWQYAPSRNEIFYVAFANTGPLPPGATQVLRAKSIQTGADRVVAELSGLTNTRSAFRVSPDGTQVAYSRWAGSGSDRHLELHVMTVEGQADRVLAPRGGPLDWSPDGRLLLHGSDKLMVTDVRSGQSWAIEQASDTDTVEWDDARWAPNGAFIVLTRDGWHDEYRAFDGLTYDDVVKAMDAKH